MAFKEHSRSTVKKVKFKISNSNQCSGIEITLQIFQNLRKRLSKLIAKNTLLNGST